MVKELLKVVLEICPSECLKEAIAFKNYEKASEILQEQKENLGYYETVNDLFNIIYKAVEKEDLKELKRIFKHWISLLYTELAEELMDHNHLLSISDCNEEYKEELEIIKEKFGWYERIKSLDLDDFCQRLLMAKDNKNAKIEACQTVFNLPYMPDIKGNVDPLINYLEALICEQVFTLYDVIDALANNDPSYLRGQVDFLAYLKMTYYELKMNELEKEIMTREQNILMIGYKKENLDGDEDNLVSFPFKR